ncbi:anthranilate synthase component I family protein [Streptomyces liangshanensis]|uniref:anthranilate synthase component I family protein n=1 Tax=Streptomyces liangshanensis TaxID=2717324 RepID=UPI001FBB4265|nr:anthranilate synthase component I family protein [Streptomyces liangshanensis]
MTTLLDNPPRPARTGRGPFTVRVEERELAPHQPLDLYAELAASYEGAAQEVFVLESVPGPGQSPGATVVGHGVLAEIRVHGDRIALSGAPAVVAALTESAARLGVGTLPGGELAPRDSAQVWDVLRAAQGLFAVETGRPLDTYAFGFLATFGYGSAWHMEELPARRRRPGADADPDIVLSLFRDTLWYGPGSTGVRRLTARSDAFGPAPDHDPVGAALAAVASRDGSVAGAELPAAPRPRSVRDSSDEATFLGRADRCLRHIGVGDIYQIQIGHRIDVDTALGPFEVYRRLRHRNPSPYMYLLPRAGRTVIGASPEVLFRAEGDEVVMRPIAGTAPRSGRPETDEPRVAALVASEKERAEHVMLVDLCRNDVGRVSVPGSLEATGLMALETFSHVFHLVSTVRGTLAEGHDTWSVLGATFPAGTVTGAPKIRAMEIIEELESEPRGMYAGAVGLIDLRGWSQLALCIRTIVHDGRTGTYSTQSCAGIVADSSPEAEWRETLHKMGAAYWALTGEELLS